MADLGLFDDAENNSANVLIMDDDEPFMTAETRTPFLIDDSVSVPERLSQYAYSGHVELRMYLAMNLHKWFSSDASLLENETLFCQILPHVFALVYDPSDEVRGNIVQCFPWIVGPLIEFSPTDLFLLYTPLLMCRSTIEEVFKDTYWDPLFHGRLDEELIWKWIDDCLNGHASQYIARELVMNEEDLIQSEAVGLLILQKWIPLLPRTILDERVRPVLESVLNQDIPNTYLVLLCIEILAKIDQDVDWIVSMVTSIPEKHQGSHINVHLLDSLPTIVRHRKQSQAVLNLCEFAELLYSSESRFSIKQAMYRAALEITLIIDPMERPLLRQLIEECIREIKITNLNTQQFYTDRLCDLVREGFDVQPLLDMISYSKSSQLRQSAIKFIPSIPRHVAPIDTVMVSLIQDPNIETSVMALKAVPDCLDNMMVDGEKNALIGAVVPLSTAHLWRHRAAFASILPSFYAPYLIPSLFSLINDSVAEVRKEAALAMRDICIKYQPTEIIEYVHHAVHFGSARQKQTIVPVINSFMKQIE